MFSFHHTFHFLFLSTMLFDLRLKILINANHCIYFKVYSSVYFKYILALFSDVIFYLLIFYIFRLIFLFISDKLQYMPWL